MTSHKTPYEIRLNLLQLAQVIESNRFTAQSIKDSIKEGNSNIASSLAPTVEDVVKAARQLNDFVSDPTDKRN